MDNHIVNILLIEDEDAHAELVLRSFEILANEFSLTTVDNLKFKVNMKLEHEYVNHSQACEILQIAKPTLYNLVSQGKVPVFKLAGGNNRYRVKDLEKLFIKR